MDGARWWNTQGILGPHGAKILRRGFPATHVFAQARIGFAVARARCQEIFDPPGCVTLWSLPAEIEDLFDEEWQGWLDDAGTWRPWIEGLASDPGADLGAFLGRLDLVSHAQLEAARKLKRSSGNRAVPIPGTHGPSDELVALLAAGFCRGEPGCPAVPYARLEA